MKQVAKHLRGAMFALFALTTLLWAWTEETPLVGIAKFVAHPALDALEKGVADELRAGIPNIRLDFQNANADISTAAQIARLFKTEKASVVVGIATPTAQALANAIKDRPVIYCAVTDPVSAGLVPSLSAGGANVTGSSDMTPVRAQIELLLALKPVRRLGYVYNAGEANSVSLGELVKGVCAEKKIAFVPATVTSSAEVRQALLAIAGRVDGVYLGNDNTVFSAISTVADICLDRKLPLVTADPSSAETVPVLAALGFDYYAMGRATGRIVLRVLSGEKTADIPAYLATDPKELLLVLNKDVAAKIGLSVSPDLVDRAAVLIEDGKVTRK